MKKKWLVRIVLGIAAVLVAAVIAVLIWQKGYYGGRWYGNTMINGVDISKQTLAESKRKLIAAHKDYKLTINARKNGSLVIDGDEISYDFKIGSQFDDLFKKQHGTMSFFGNKREYTMDYDVSYNKKKVAKIASESALMTGKGYKIKKPVNAHVKYSSEKKQYECVAERAGNKLRKKAFINAVKEALQEAKTEIDLSDEKAYPDVYKKPKITSEDEDLQTALNACNNAAIRFITWNMGKGVTEQITPEEISQWITYKNGSVKYDKDAIADWVEAFCLKYKTVGKDRVIKDHNGKDVTIHGGDYGWQMDYEKTLSQTMKALKKTIDSSLTDAYIQDPSEDNQNALTIKRKVVYLNTAFQKDYENFAVDWDTENYTEISLADQMVYVFRNGKVKYSCKCISGKPVEGRTTPTGAYFIKEHNEHRVLRGETYVTPVDSWVRITWSGTGFHAAPWQRWGSWTKDYYKVRGSHGCLNLEPSVAKEIYNLVQYREAVFIH